MSTSPTSEPTAPLPARMRAAVITGPGGPEVLRLEERPVPEPAAGEVLVRVVHSALNRADLAQRAGRYPAPAGAPPDIPGLEYAGTVAALGPGVSRWSVGDRVFGLVPGGAHAEYLVTHADTLARVPDGLPLDVAGTLPEAFITAHDALVTQAGGIGAGDAVLVHAVGSGVGLAAVQLIKALGGVAYGTARTPSKLDDARALGMTDGVVPATSDDGTPQFARVVQDWTGGRGARVILDLVGGAYVREGVRALAPRGTLVLIGILAGAESNLELGRILTKRLTIRGTVLRARGLAERVAFTQAFVRDVVPLLANGALSLPVFATYGLEEMAEAHAAMASNASVGKIGIRVSA